MLIIEKISKTFTHSRREKTLFKEFSLNMQGGDFIALCGPGGCGKTTLMLMAGGLLPPDAGTIYLHGRDIYSLPSDICAEFRAEHMGFIFQQPHLLPYLNVIDNICLPDLANHTQNSVTRAKKLADNLGLSDKAAHLPSELTTGECQLTALARALLNSPSLILADEPAGNLDKDNADIIISTLRKFADSGNCVIMFTRNRNTAEKADKIIGL